MLLQIYIVLIIYIVAQFVALQEMETAMVATIAEILCNMQ